MGRIRTGDVRAAAVTVAGVAAVVRNRVPTRVGVVATLALGLALSGCTRPDPTLLDPGDVDGVVEATHDADEATAPGWTWCSPLDPYAYFRLTPTSRLRFDGRASAGATIVDRTADGFSADYLLATFEEKAQLCEDGLNAADGDTIGPLTGLGADTVGWRTETADGRQGELALIRLDDARLLVVGVETDQAELPISLADLMRLAREGAERVR